MKTVNPNMITSNISVSRRSWVAGLLVAGLLGLGMRANAATFALSPNSQSVPVGSTFTVTLIANLGTTSAVNAIEADLTYSSSLLQLVSTDDTSSPFTAWRQVTPGAGTLSFVQAQPNPGLTGDNLAVAVIRFFAKSGGTATVQFNNATCAIVLNSNNSNVYSPSTGGSYTLNGADTVPPTISAVAASPIYVSSAAITWTTDELSDSQISYGLTNALGTSNSLNSTMVTSHSMSLSGLTANTSYFYVVKSRDAAGNLAISSTATFTTLAAPDTTPPTISNISVGVQLTSATISWTTNELSDTQVNYGVTTGMSQSSTLNTSLVTNHLVTLTGLTAGTTYFYRVNSRDAAGNLAQSGGTLQFVTKAIVVAVNQPPTVVLSTLQAAPYVVGTALTLTATAADSDGTIATVQFYLGGALIGSKTGAPYTFSYVPPFNGTYVFSAVATDNLGAMSAPSILQLSVVQLLPAPVLNLPRYVKPRDIIKVTYPDGYSINHFEWTFSKINTAAVHAAPGAVAAQSVTSTQATLDMSTVHLDAGDYNVSVRAIDNFGAASPTSSAVITMAPASFDGVKIYPNPWREDKHAGQPITFTNMPLTATVKIFTTSGQWVKTITAVNGTATWDLKNDSGDKAASGLYFYLATDDQGAKPTKGKFVIIK